MNVFLSHTRQNFVSFSLARSNRSSSLRAARFFAFLAALAAFLACFLTCFSRLRCSFASCAASTAACASASLCLLTSSNFCFCFFGCVLGSRGCFDVASFFPLVKSIGLRFVVLEAPLDLGARTYGGEELDHPSVDCFFFFNIGLFPRGLSPTFLLFACALDDNKWRRCLSRVCGSCLCDLRLCNLGRLEPVFTTWCGLALLCCSEWR